MEIVLANVSPVFYLRVRITSFQHTVAREGEYLCRYSIDVSRFQSRSFSGISALSVDFPPFLFSQLDK